MFPPVISMTLGRWICGAKNKQLIIQQLAREQGVDPSSIRIDIGSRRRLLTGGLTLIYTIVTATNPSAIQVNASNYTEGNGSRSSSSSGLSATITDLSQLFMSVFQNDAVASQLNITSPIVANVTEAGVATVIQARNSTSMASTTLHHQWTLR